MILIRIVILIRIAILIINDNYGGNVDLGNMDVNSQDAQQSLPQLKLILKQLDSTLKLLNSILNPSTASTQLVVEQRLDR